MEIQYLTLINRDNQGVVLDEKAIILVMEIFEKACSLEKWDLLKNLYLS